ncbi:MAG TPA: iron ABC transporter permease [Candidatus Baltobacteraceae bacterium]|nr:iron ABC transporter permease [Candidatus Baltobacteraceae bacterium]
MSARLAGLLLLTLAALGGSLLVGGTWLSPASVVSALLHPRADEVATIVWQLRLPRVVIGAIVGASLGIAGALLQGMLRNPLVDPFLTGVSAGAAVAIVAGMAIGVSSAAVPALGFCSGTATAIVVAALARRGAGLDPTRLILAGVSISSLCSSIIALILTHLQSSDAAPSIVGWLAGSLSGRGWNELAFCAPYLCAGVLLAAAAVPALNALRLGDVRAASSGLDVARAQWIILGSTSLLTACSVTLAGTVGFVGLIVPHVARRAAGSNARYALPASALLGAAVTVAADAACRSIAAPTEIPLGVLLAFAGVPAFLYLYLRGSRPVTA